MRRLIPKSRGGSLVRSLVAGVLVIAFAATATAVAGLLQVKEITHYLDATPALPVSKAVTVPNPGSPQTILLVGSDHRAGEPFRYSNTDTMMLVHIDPGSSTINLLSVPRDLRVQIPEGGAVATAKLNAAYSIGGDNLLVKILSSVPSSWMIWSCENWDLAHRMKSCWRALRTMSLSVWRKRTNASASVPHSFW